MTESLASPAAGGPTPLWRAVLGDRHFLVAAGLLAVTAGGWNLAVDLLKLATTKLPVPWPQGAVVDSDHRLLSFPERLGPFERAGDGELSPDGNKDGQPDGEYVFNPTDLDTLGIATGFDRTRHASRRSNWYLSRLYVDRRPAARPKYWRLDLTYYTGGLDLVPHVPDICLAAAGMGVLGSEEVTFGVPGAAPGWEKDLRFRRTRYEDRSGRQLVVYYGFSLNGRPEQSREAVRGKLMNPFMRYSYFAKVQFYPLGTEETLGETDRKAEAFLCYALPEILKALPSAGDVQALESR